MTGCGGGGSSSAPAADGSADAPAAESAGGDSAASGSGEDIQIRIMTRWSDDAPYSVYFRQKLQEFNEMDNGITIVDESLSEEAAFLDKLRSSIATGNQPEVFIEYGGARILDYVDAGILLDIQPYLDADPDWRDSFLDDLFAKWHYDEYPGTFGVPCQFYSVFLYYNKSMLAEHGFDAPPESLDEWRDMCQALLDAGQQPMSLGEKDIWRAGHFLNNLVIKSFGSTGVEALADRTMKYDSPEMVELYGIIKEFNDKGFFGPNAVGVDGSTEDADFLSKKVPLKFQGTWFIPQVAADYEGDISDIGIAPFPYINEEYKHAYQGGTAEAFSVSNREATNDAAVEVVKYFTNKDYYAGAEAHCQGGVYVSKFDTLDGVEIDPLTISAKEQLAAAKEFRDDIQTYDPESMTMDICRAAVQGLFIGNTPEQCGEEIVNQLQIK